jgi:DNA-binding Lrp family transcriptional regulator
MAIENGGGNPELSKPHIEVPRGESLREPRPGGIAGLPTNPIGGANPEGLGYSPAYDTVPEGRSFPQRAGIPGAGTEHGVPRSEVEGAFREASAGGPPQEPSDTPQAGGEGGTPREGSETPVSDADRYRGKGPEDMSPYGDFSAGRREGREEPEYQPPLIRRTTDPGEVLLRTGERVHVTEDAASVAAEIGEGVFAALGASPKQIADKLGVQPGTVRNRVSELRSDLLEHGIKIHYDPEQGGYYMEHPTTRHLEPPVDTSSLHEQRDVPRYVERQKLRTLDRTLPRTDEATDRVTGLVTQRELLESADVPPADLARYLREYEENVLEPQGLRLGSIGRQGGKEQLYWVEQAPPEGSNVTVMGEYVRSGDAEAELSPADSFVLDRLTRPRDKAAFDERVSSLADAEGVPGDVRIARVNAKLEALTGQQDLIVADGNDEVGYFYRLHGVDVDRKPTFNPVPANDLDALNKLLEGRDPQEVISTVTAKGVPEGGTPHLRTFYQLRSDILKLINRGRAEMLRTESAVAGVPSEAETYDRVVRSMEEQHINLDSLLGRMAAALGAPQDQVRLEDAHQQLEVPIPRRFMRRV